MVTPQGIPVSCEMLPASLPGYPLAGGITPVHDLTQRLPTGVTVYGDKAYNSADDEAWIDGETGIRLIPHRRENMAPNTENEQAGLRRHREWVERVNSQLEAWGVQRLYARTHEGWLIKVLASLFALLCVNADEQSRQCDVRISLDQMREKKAMIVNARNGDLVGDRRTRWRSYNRCSVWTRSIHRAMRRWLHAVLGITSIRFRDAT